MGLDGDSSKSASYYRVLIRIETETETDINIVDPRINEIMKARSRGLLH